MVAPFLPLGITDITCEKFVRSLDLCAVPTAAITGDISFVHACGGGCVFKKETGARRIEREETQLTGTISFHHDPNNQVYLLNRFCLNDWLVKLSFIFFTAFSLILCISYYSANKYIIASYDNRKRSARIRYRLDRICSRPVPDPYQSRSGPFPYSIQIRYTHNRKQD